MLTDFFTVSSWSKMSNYEKITIPQRMWTRSRVLYDYDTLDICYLQFPDIPSIIIAVDSHSENNVGEYIPDFNSATIYVYDRTLVFAMVCDILFRNTSYFDQQSWFRLFIIESVRKHYKPINWILRKSLLLVCHTNVEIEKKKNLLLHSTCTNALEQVFHNRMLVCFILKFV
jgi:hypothetical protein